MKTAAGLTLLLVGSTTAQDVTWCTKAPQSGWDLCNAALAVDVRAKDAVARLSLADKFDALGTATGTLTSIGLPPYNWWSEATHGISHVSYSPELPGASNTALPITTSCSFNRTLWTKTGNQIGREGRAFQNAGKAFSTYWAPVSLAFRGGEFFVGFLPLKDDVFVSNLHLLECVP